MSKVMLKLTVFESGKLDLKSVLVEEDVGRLLAEVIMNLPQAMRTAFLTESVKIREFTIADGMAAIETLESLLAEKNKTRG